MCVRNVGYTASRTVIVAKLLSCFAFAILKLFLVLYTEQSLMLGGARSSSMQPYSLVHGYQLTVGVKCWYVMMETAGDLVRPSVACCDGVFSNGGLKRVRRVLKLIELP